MSTLHPFDDLINFLANMAPEQVLAFRASEETVRRLQELVLLEREQKITSDERAELERFLLQEDLMVIAKARARVQLARV
ncbi:MAG: hypothetical protein J0L99_10200 [Chitinophagales bacterium]|nr:hypothetical protein [Chitinophagales bacterium]